MSNYPNNIDLRVDVAALANATYELREQFRAFEKKYFWGSEALTEQLAGQVINQLNAQILEIYKQMNELDTPSKTDRCKHGPARRGYSLYPMFARSNVNGHRTGAAVATPLRLPLHFDGVVHIPEYKC